MLLFYLFVSLPDVLLTAPNAVSNSSLSKFIVFYSLRLGSDANLA